MANWILKWKLVPLSRCFLMAAFSLKRQYLIMKMTKLFSSLPIPACMTALVVFAGVVPASAADLARVSLNDDWRFIKGDPANLTDNLAYPRVQRSGRRGGAPTNAPAAPAPTSGIAQYVLPTGDSLIADPAKRYAKPDGNYGADIPYVSPSFDDSGWRQLDLPHDFGIEGPFLAPGQPGSDGGTGRRPFFGAAWYRKHLSIPASDAGKQFYLDIDGAMSYSTVWCNGQIVGGWPYGYSSWRVDLTPMIKPGADNVLAIRLDNPPNSSRWYPGGGIYRNVWLTKTAPVHVAQWGTFVTTPEVSAKSATVTLKVTVNNTAHQSAVVSVMDEIFSLDKNNNKSRTAVASITTDNVTVDGASLTVSGEGGSATVESKITFANPKLWSPATPNRYVAVTTIKQAGAIVDQYETRFGIRTVKYDPAAGLFINGEHFKLNGVCDHHDLGSLGTALNFRALQRQLEMLHDMGCNALRTSHNPPAPELLDLADQMGFMVLDEAFDTWGQNKTRNDYGGGNLFNMWHEQDLRALVRRDRNHPSVVLWSIGNEIAEQNQGSNSVIAKELAGIVHSEDPTRPVTAACNDGSAMDNGFSSLLDAMGFNYKPDNYIRFHQRYTNEFFFSTESASTISSRGEYFFPVTSSPFGTVNGRGRGGQPNGSQDDTVHQMSSYDLYYPGWASSPDHEFFGQDHSPAVAGEFVWTGFDYIGEPTPWGGGSDPSRSSYFGIIDLAGFPKDRFYLYQAHWRPAYPMAHILPHWNWTERAADPKANPPKAAQVTPVHVYTSGDEAELFLNGKSLGKKKKVFDTPNNAQLNGQPAYRIRWDNVPYEPGELKVVAYKNGKKWATDTVKTTGEASRLTLKPDRSTIAGDGHDISYVKLAVVDKSGLMVPRSKNLVHFSITGPGEIVATDNGDATDLSSFQATDRRAFNGLALAIVKAKRGQHGVITVTATSEGLAPAKTTIKIK
jgi:beta-galactosidase